MLFSSITFLYYFLSLTLLIYFLVPKKAKNLILLISSLFFYAWGEPRYVVIMALSVIVNYFLGIGIEYFRGKALSKVLLILSLVFSLGILGYFKYADFFLQSFSAITGIKIPLLRIALPIGISFYTFQILSYTVDVYRGRVKAQKSIITLGTYIALFPQLIAGPIVRYSDVEKQLKRRTHSVSKAYEGIRYFVMGLSKKVILANTLGELCDTLAITSDKSVLGSWLYVFSYMLQIFFDFSGYSHMAIGLGKILGFDFMENFRYPFISRSISEFWRRWHISLGSWFRDYVYIPMGGNRVGHIRFAINIFTVWFLTGLWHGAQWNFVVWGLYFGVLLLLEKLFLSRFILRIKAVSHIYVLFFVAISFAIFSASSMEGAMELLSSMFGLSGIPLTSAVSLYSLSNYFWVLVCGVLLSTPVFAKVKTIITNRKGTTLLYDIFEIPYLMALLTICTAYLADGSFNPFLYFRF